MKKFIFTFLIIFLSSVSLYCQFGGGDGTEQNPYLIATAEQLDSTRYFGGNSHFRLIADIDLGVPPYNQGEGWIPINRYSAKIRQISYHGGGYKIKNLYINRPNEDNVGLFKIFTNTAIDSLEIENCNIIGKSNVGGLIGRNSSVYEEYITERIIQNCKVSGKIIARSHAGGIAGLSLGSQSCRCIIKNCYTNVDIFVSERYAGGIVSDAYYDSIINCHFIGTIEGMGGPDTGDIIPDFGSYLGGIGGIASSGYYISSCSSVGILKGRSVAGICVWLIGTASRCYSNCDIYSYNFPRMLIGTVPHNDEKKIILDCYSTGKIITLSDSCVTIGLIGDISNELTVKNVYSLGNFNGKSNIGGIVGYYLNWNNIVEHSVAINDYLNGNSNVHRVVGSAYNKSVLTNNYALDSMRVNGFIRTSYDGSSLDGHNISHDTLLTQDFWENTLGWNFDTVWKMCDSCKYPILQWQDCDGEGCTPKTSIEEKQKINITISPNPTINEISVSFNLEKSEVISIDIVDLEGKFIENIFSGIVDTGQFIRIFQVNKLASATYFMKIKIGYRTQFEKFVKK